MLIKDNHYKFTEFRKNYPKFEIRLLNCDITDFGVELVCLYKISEKIEFRHVLRINCSNTSKIKDRLISDNKFLDYVLLSEGLMYYKSICSPEIELASSKLTNKEALWWQDIYYRNLSEFIYINNIKEKESSFVKINFADKDNNPELISDNFNHLIYFDGTKDSVLSTNLLKDFKDSNTLLIIEPDDRKRLAAKECGYNNESIVELERVVDKKLDELNKDGYLNGPISFELSNSFIAIFMAYIFNIKNVVMNFHMYETKNKFEYTKSFEFEKNIHEYVLRFSNFDINYFSILRNINDREAFRLFSKYRSHLNLFSACNSRTSIEDKEHGFCANCSSCLYNFIMLSEHIEIANIEKAFKTNMFRDYTMISDMDILIGKTFSDDIRYIDKELVNCALSVILLKYNGESSEMPALLKYYYEDCKKFHIKSSKLKKKTRYTYKNTLIPKEYYYILD